MESGPKILLVEDSPVQAELYASILRTSPLRALVELACTAAEAVSVLSKDADSYDLVVTDLGLPDSRGADVVKELAKFRVPIVVNTIISDFHVARECVNAGCTAFVHKGEVADYARRAAPTLLAAAAVGKRESERVSTPSG